MHRGAHLLGRQLSSSAAPVVFQQHWGPPGAGVPARAVLRAAGGPGPYGKDSSALCYVCILIVCCNLACEAFVPNALLCLFAVAASGCRCSDLELHSCPLATTLKRQAARSAAITFPWALPRKCQCWGALGEITNHQRHLETCRAQKTWLYCGNKLHKSRAGQMQPVSSTEGGHSRWALPQGSVIVLPNMSLSHTLKSMILPSNLLLLWSLFPHLFVLVPLGTWQCWEPVKRLHRT